MQTSKSSLDKYFSDLAGFSPLKHEPLMEEFKLLSTLTGPEAVRQKNKIVTTNLRLVVSIAKNFQKSGIPLEDLIQEGNIGLMKAVEKFDYTRNLRFSPYAQFWILQAIRQLIIKMRKPIRLPAHAASIYRDILKVMSDFHKENHRDPSYDEIVDLVGKSKNIVRATLFANAQLMSLEEPSYKGGINSPGQREHTLRDMLPDANNKSPFSAFSNHELLGVVNQVFASLSEKETEILKLRCGLNSEDNEENIEELEEQVDEFDEDE
jgi:RNA polymerase primary sigma factor